MKYINSLYVLLNSRSQAGTIGSAMATNFPRLIKIDPDFENQFIIR
jgi:hypothetical protein